MGLEWSGKPDVMVLLQEESYSGPSCLQKLAEWYLCISHAVLERPWCMSSEDCTLSRDLPPGCLCLCKQVSWLLCSSFMYVARRRRPKQKFSNIGTYTSACVCTNAHTLLLYMIPGCSSMHGPPIRGTQSLSLTTAPKLQTFTCFVAPVLLYICYFYFNWFSFITNIN